jgi:hypothetical protein
VMGRLRKGLGLTMCEFLAFFFCFVLVLGSWLLEVRSALFWLTID